MAPKQQHDTCVRLRKYGLFAVLLLSVSSWHLRAAALQSETLKAWEAYAAEVSAHAQAAFSMEAPFIRNSGNKDTLEKVREGQLVVVPVGQTPRRIPGGLIHHWMGTVFIPGASIDPVLAVVRDYRHYRDYYHPAVIASRLIASEAQSDRFAMVLTSKSLISKTALEGEYQTSLRKVDDQHWYSISRSTRIREIQNYGTSGQHALDEDEGSGLIWRLLSIDRFEQAEGGVYVQMEAVALSRDIPSSLRWIITPIVRRVSRESLATSLQQTNDAVLSRDTVAARAAHPRETSDSPTLAVSTFTLVP